MTFNRPFLALCPGIVLCVVALAGCGDSAQADPDACDPSVERGCVEGDLPGRGPGRGGDDPEGSGDADAGGRDLGGGPPPCDTRTCAELDGFGVVPPDTDDDGIPDCVEGIDDSDGDGPADCVDTDADDDGMPDSVEGAGDADGDSIRDYVDEDSDNDNIADRFEGSGDIDEDGTPNYLDLDSDGDGWPDAAEYGQAPGEGTPPVDRDGDGEADFLDLDSDGDGLADDDERGCPTSTDRTVWDSDGDGYNDLVEVAFGSDPCDDADDISELVDFYFELPFRGPEQTDTLLFSTDVQFGDVVFNMDTTGSMSGEISTLRTTLESTIIPALGERLDSVGYAVTRFDDFPCGGGGSGDVAFELVQRVTLSRGDARDGVDALGASGGGDGPESGIEALYQIATGVGGSECGSPPPFDPTRDEVPGVADGRIGGVGFRAGSMPIIVHITDNSTHARGESYGFGATRAEAYDALSAIGARVVGVSSGGAARADSEQFAAETGAAVPPCAWGDGRPGSCGTSECCTGNGGAGRATNGAGLCPLVFDIDDGGRGLDTSIVSGIDALVNYAPVEVSAVARRDPEEPDVDTACFLRAIRPDTFIASTEACTGEPVAADTDGDSMPDVFENVTPGTQLFFQVIAENPDCAPPLGEPQVFIAYIDVVANGSAVLDTKLVTILVPPDIKF